MEIQPVSVKSVFEIFQDELQDIYDEREIKEFIYLLFYEWKEWNKMQVRLNYHEMLSYEESSRFFNALISLKFHVPVQQVTGKTFFCGYPLVITPDVLIPRQETEELVEMVVKENQKRKTEKMAILDIGTGSGCIAISLKKNFPLSSVTALDNSEKALSVARDNSKRNDCHIEFFHSDILSGKEWIQFPFFDLIVSNPPYVLESEKELMRKNVTEYEPWDALFVPDHDPFRFYDAIAGFAILHLNIYGKIYLEINERFGSEVRSILVNKGFDKAEVIKDIHGKERFIRAGLT